ncbi:MAG: S8 family serine peptidase [Eubacterium sp.]|nr:S8 family serine peptidase [Eubacterium sp.]
MRLKIKCRKVIGLLLVVSLSIGMFAGHNTYGTCLNPYEKILNELKATKQSRIKDKSSYIISAKDNTSYNEIKEDYKNIIVRESDSYNEKNNILLVSVNEEQAQALETEDGIIRVEKDFYVSASGRKTKVKKNKGIDSKVAWNLQMINADKVESISDKKVKVAIIDSGIDGISGINVKARIDLTDKDGKRNSFMEDFTGHGTSVAGIISGNAGQNSVQGINSNVELYSAKVLDDKNVAPISRVVEAIYWAIEQKVDIINLSFGTKVYSRVLEQAIEKAYKENIILIAAAGNSGNEVEYPAAFRQVIAVGGINAEGEISDNSVIAEGIELMAPGEMVKTVGAFGGVTAADGTSMATPHVTAIASILLEKDYAVSNEFIRYLMNVSAKSMGIKGTGYGVVDLKYAIDNYDRIKRDYNNDKSEIKKSYNKEHLQTFDKDNLVEARWIQDKHGYLVQIAYDSNNVYLEDWEVNRIKIGATQIDDIFPSHYGQADDSSFLHGYKNYVANYIYLTHAAYEIYNDSYTKYLNGNTKVAGANVTAIKDRISRFPWSNYQNNTNWKKSLMVFGMALHVIGDAYAHRSFAKQNGVYVHIKHNTNWSISADNHLYYPERELGARTVINKAFKQYFDTGTTGTYKQFVHNNYTTYKLDQLYTFSKKTTESEGGSVSKDATTLKNASYGD